MTVGNGHIAFSVLVDWSAREESEWRRQEPRVWVGEQIARGLARVGEGHTLQPNANMLFYLNKQKHIIITDDIYINHWYYG